MQLITSEILREQAYKKEKSGRAIVYKHGIKDAAGLNANRNETLMDTVVKVKSKDYKSPYEMKLNNRESVASRIAQGNFALHQPDDLYDFVDATRLDVTRRVLAEPILFQFIYNVLSNPNFTKTMTLQEILPIGVVFAENEGSGESVKLGDFKTGSTETITQEILAAGYTWDLAFEMYNVLFDMQRLNDAVARAYAAEVNDSHLDPIITGTYTGDKATAASTVGDTWMEKWYHTILDARRDLREREDPITGKRIDTSGTVLLCSKADAEDVMWVINGQLNSPADSKNLSTIPGIQTVLGYDGDEITVGDKTYSYDGVSDGTCFLIKPIPRGFISAWKRQLTALVQSQGNILNLERERRAWYYVRGIYNTFGITNYVQKITLPTR
ncbi:MAG: hypothetical protein GWN64_07925 [Candidatus Thorarchaeota archaeon]|nr:hypothetical protein [Candidatus Thorarchaeota archaeon]